MFYWTLVHERYDVGPNVSRSQPPALWVWAGNMNWKVAQNRRSVWPIVVRKIHSNRDIPANVLMVSTVVR
jgi:hypothetical protein